MNSRRIATRCFTLIEMLVVVAIIGILAGLLVPAISKARWHAWNAKCKSNLKNLQVATMNRAFDCDGWLPYAQSREVWREDWQDWESAHGWVHWNHPNKVDGGGSHVKSITPGATESAQSYGCQGDTRWWGIDCWNSITNGSIWEYTGKNLNVYSCSIFIKVQKVEGAGSATPLQSNKPGIYAVRSYAMNSQVSNRRMGDLEPSKRALFADTTESTMPPGFSVQISQRRMGENVKWSWDGELMCVPYSSYALESIGQYHPGNKGNVIFVDGHVESLTWQQATNACSGNW